MVLAIVGVGVTVLFVPLIFVVLLDIRNNTRELLEELETREREEK